MELGAFEVGVARVDSVEVCTPEACFAWRCARRVGASEVYLIELIVSLKHDDTWVRSCGDLRICLAWPSQFGTLTSCIEVDRES